MNEEMSTRFRVDILRGLSMQRLGPYLQFVDGDVESAIRLYQWNVNVSAAFFEMLAAVEVIVRNSVSDQLEAWNTEHCFGGIWLDNHHGYLRPGAVVAIEEAKQRISRDRLD